MAVLIDTSILIDAERRGERLERALGNEERAISVVTASELLHGVHRAGDEGVRVRRQVFVEHILGALDPLPITTKVARSHARLWAHLEQTGQLIGAHDLWIAATALAHGMSIATDNVRHFERVPGLTVVALS
jgi:tRNA(fMet)-specific endonuclease VapC